MTDQELAELRQVAEECPRESQQVCLKCGQYVSTKCSCFERHRFILRANREMVLALLNEIDSLHADDIARPAPAGKSVPR